MSCESKGRSCRRRKGGAARRPSERGELRGLSICSRLLISFEGFDALTLPLVGYSRTKSGPPFSFDPRAKHAALRSLSLCLHLNNPRGQGLRHSVSTQDGSLRSSTGRLHHSSRIRPPTPASLGALAPTRCLRSALRSSSVQPRVRVIDY